MQLLHLHIYKALWLLLALAGPLLGLAQYTDTVCVGHTGRLYGADSVAGQTYTWLVQGGTITAGQGGPTISVNWGNTPGTGIVMAVPQITGGCNGDTLKGFVLIEDKTQVTITAPDTVCQNQTVQLLGTGAVNYRWSTGDTASSIFLTITGGTDVWLVGNNGGCNSDTAFAGIAAVSPPQASISGVLPAELYQGDSVSFVFDGSGADRIYWFVDNYRQTLTPAQQFSPLITYPGNYMLMQVAAYKGQCFDTAYFNFTMEPLGDAFIPNAFSPNGDNLNNVFEVDGNGNTYIELTIYDRWGGIIYNAKGKDKLAWDGQFKGVPVPLGVYAYHVTARRGINTTKHYRGTITVIR